MKTSSAQGLTRSRASLVALLALAASVGIAGCGGSGASGPKEPTGGGSGGTGPTGPTGPTGVPIVDGGPVNNMGTGSGLTAQQVQDIGALIATIDTASVCTATSCGIASSANHPVVEFTVKTAHGGPVLGLAPGTLRLGVAKLVPAANAMPSRWQSYRNSLAQGPNPAVAPALPSAIQATTETGSSTQATCLTGYPCWTELGNGRYRYVAALNLATVTSPIAVSYEPTLTHRYSIALNLTSSNGNKALELDPDNPFYDFVPAGGPVTTEKLVASTVRCDTCHVRFAEHGGSRRTVEYCDVCHNAATTDPDSGQSVDLAYMVHSIHMGKDRSPGFVIYGFNGAEENYSDVTYPQPKTFCEKCHTQTAATPQGDDWMVTTTTATCGGCHAAGINKTYSTTTGMYTYSYTHSTLVLPPGYTAPDGTCKDCHRADGAAGDAYAIHSQDPDRKAIVNGKLFTYKILSVQNAAVGQAPKVTFQILQNGVPVNVKALTSADGRLRLDFGWTTQDIHNVADIAGNQYAADRGEAIVIDLIANMASVVDNGDGTYSYTLAQPLPSGFSDPLLGTGLMVVLEGRRVVDGTNAYPDSAFFFAGGTPRPQIVDKAKCNLCHEQVSFHGGSRAGDPMICTICHSPSVGGTFGADDFGPLALGAFLHGVHNGSVALPPDYDPATYPHNLGRCESCHVAGSFNLARPAALPMTINAGADPLAWQDDLANSATAGTCKGCHTTPEAQTHMESQGGTFGVPKTLVPSSASEGCAFCHAAGRTYDTRVEHCNNLPLGQCVTP